MTHPRTTRRIRSAGFTMVELMVSAGILVIISSLVLVQHARFSGNLLISNLAYDMALTLRQAQVYGLSVREFGTGSGEFDIGYGVHFDQATPTSYVLFVDRDKNGLYGGSTENVEIFTLRQGNFIRDFCATLPSGAEKCSGSSFTTLDIVFVRPNPDAHIRSDIVGDLYESARTTVESRQGVTRTIDVVATGQISVPQLSQ